MPRWIPFLIASFMTLPLPGATFPAESAVKTIEAVREKAFLRPVERRTIRREEMRAYLERQMDADLPISSADFIKVIQALHLIGPGGKPLTELLDLYEAQVLAFYDPEAHVFYALDRPPDGAEMVPFLENAVEVHELTHALQDQVFDSGLILLAARGAWDRQLAYQSVVEGEATLVMLGSMVRFLGTSIDDLASDDAIVGSMEEAAKMMQNDDAGAPPYFVESMKFPYMAGLRLVLAAYRRGKWDGVNRLHSNPPASTEEVLHPEIYFSRGSDGNLDPEAPPMNEGALFSTTLGEFHWRFLLGERPAQGWASDKVALIRGENQKLTTLVDTSWDSERDAEEFASAYRSFLESKGEKPSVECAGVRVRVAYGADEARARSFVRTVLAGAE